MLHKTWSVSLLIILSLVASFTLVSAQGLGPQRDVSTQVAAAAPHNASVGTAFTYQGQLKSGGNPVNGVCDFQEEEKPADEQGTYLYPAGYGQPPETGLDYRRQIERLAHRFNIPPATSPSEE